MRILYIVKGLHTRGGIETSLLQQIPALKERGIDSAVVSPNGGLVARELEEKGVRVFLPTADLGDIRYHNRNDWQRTIRDSADSYQPDILYPHQIHTIFPSVSARDVPTIGAIHTRIFDWANEKEIAECREIFPSLQKIHVVGSDAEKQARSLGAKNTVRIFPSVLGSPMLSDARSAPMQNPRLVFVGRPDRRKGLDVLLKALSLLQRDFPGISLVVVGNDGKTERYNGGGLDLPLAQNLGLEKRVSWRGSALHSEVLAQMVQSDLLVVPSIIETFSAVAAEGHSLALPVVGTEAIAEILNNGAIGRMVPTGNHQLLAASIAESLQDKHRLDKAKAAKRWVLREYSLKKLIQIISNDFNMVKRS